MASDQCSSRPGFVGDDLRHQFCGDVLNGKMSEREPWE